MPRNDIKILIGEFNTQVGRKECVTQIIAGTSKYQKSNENEIKLIELIEFAMEKNMGIMSTILEHKNIHKDT